MAILNVERRVINNYCWDEIVFEFMSNDKILPLDEVVILNVSTEKQSECVMAQLIAKYWGLA